MNLDKRSLLLLAAVATTVVGAVAASKARRRQRRPVPDVQQKENVKSWENEGGNLAPDAVSPART